MCLFKYEENLSNFLFLSLLLFLIYFILQDNSNKSNQSSSSLKNGSSDSSSDHSTTAVRPRAIDNSSLVAPSSVKVLFLKFLKDVYTLNFILTKNRQPYWLAKVEGYEKILKRVKIMKLHQKPFGKHFLHGMVEAPLYPDRYISTQ